MDRWCRIVVLLAAAGLSVQTAPAAEAPGRHRLVTVEGDDRNLLQLGAGSFDVQDRNRSALLNLEYRFGKKLLVVGPALGVFANDDGGFYGYFGLYVDIAIGRVHVTPELAAGYYRQGDSKDLGGPFEFRESLDLAYRFANGMRLGVRIAHNSNAGIYKENSGQEDAQLTVAAPLGPVFE